MMKLGNNYEDKNSRHTCWHNLGTPTKDFSISVVLKC